MKRLRQKETTGKTCESIGPHSKPRLSAMVLFCFAWLALFAGAGRAAVIRDAGQFNERFFAFPINETVADKWLLMSIRAEPPGQIRLKLQKTSRMRHVDVVIQNREGDSRYDAVTPSFGISIETGISIGVDIPADDRALLDRIHEVLLKNDHGQNRLVFDAPGELQMVNRTTTGGAPGMPPQRVMALLIMFAFVLSLALFVLAPAESRNAGFFLALVVLSVATRFFFMPDLVIENDYEDYHIYVLAVQDPDLGDIPDRHVKFKTVFLQRAFLYLTGPNMDNLFHLARFFSAMLVVLVYLLGLEFRIGNRAAWLAALLALAGPGLLMCSAIVTRHVPAICMLLLSLYLLLIAMRHRDQWGYVLYALSFGVLCVATLQKMDFIYFPALYFLTAFLYSHGSERLDMKKMLRIALAAVCTITFLALISYVDVKLNLKWSASTQHTRDKFSTISGFSPLLFVHYIFMSTVLPAMALAPAIPAKLLAIAALPRKSININFRIIVAAAFAFFILQYLPTYFSEIAKKIIKYAVPAPFIYLAAGALLDSWLTLSRKAAVILALVFIAAVNVFHYKHIRDVYVSLPRMHDFRLMRENQARINNCTVIYTTYPRPHSPFFILAAQNPDAAIRPAAFSSLLEKDSRPRKLLGEMDYYLHDIIHNQYMDMPDTRGILDFYAGYFRIQPHLYDPIILDTVRDRASEMERKIRSGTEWNPESKNKKSFFTDEAQRMIHSGQCVLFLEDSYGKSWFSNTVRTDIKTRYAESFLKLEPLAAHEEAKLYKVTGMAGD